MNIYIWSAADESIDDGVCSSLDEIHYQACCLNCCAKGSDHCDTTFVQTQKLDRVPSNVC